MLLPANVVNSLFRLFQKHVPATLTNELLHMLALEVLSRVAAECRGCLFSVICDEVSDRANHELMSVVVRYVQDSGLVQETLIGLVHVQSTGAAYLTDVIVKQMHELNLSLDCIVGQCYDGASNILVCKRDLRKHARGNHFLCTAGRII